MLYSDLKGENNTSPTRVSDIRAPYAVGENRNRTDLEERIAQYEVRLETLSRKIEELEETVSSLGTTARDGESARP